MSMLSLSSVGPILICATLGFPAHAANKCVDANGKVSFQDAPCPKNSKSSESIRLRENTVNNGLGRLAAPERLVFGQNTASDFILASAALELLSTNGSDCEIEIKVRPDSDQAYASCNRFLSQFRAWYEPARKQLLVILEDREWNSQNVRSVSNAVAEMEKARRHHTFIALHYRNR